MVSLCENAFVLKEVDLLNMIAPSLLAVTECALPREITSSRGGQYIYSPLGRPVALSSSPTQSWMVCTCELLRTSTHDALSSIVHGVF